MIARHALLSLEFDEACWGLRFRFRAEDVRSRLGGLRPGGDVSWGKGRRLCVSRYTGLRV